MRQPELFTKKIEEIKVLIPPSVKEENKNINIAIPDGFAIDETAMIEYLKINKAKAWVKDNLKEGVKYAKIEILSKLYNNYGRTKSSKELEAKADDMFNFLLWEEMIAWGWENSNENIWIQNL